jgi:hypothetical protein
MSILALALKTKTDPMAISVTVRQTTILAIVRLSGIIFTTKDYPQNETNNQSEKSKVIGVQSR